MAPKRSWLSNDLAKSFLEALLSSPPGNQGGGNTAGQTRRRPRGGKKQRKEKEKETEKEQADAPEAPRGPEARHEEALSKVAQLEAALAALGGASASGSAAGALRTELAAAKRGAREAPVGVRLDGCQAYVERAERRLAEAQAAEAKATELRREREQELEEGKSRFAALRKEAAEADKTAAAAAPQGDASTENTVEQFQAQLQETRAELEAARAEAGGGVGAAGQLQVQLQQTRAELEAARTEAATRSRSRERRRGGHKEDDFTKLSVETLKSRLELATPALKTALAKGEFRDAEKHVQEVQLLTSALSRASD